MAHHPVGEWVKDPLAPSGYRWQRHDQTPPTGPLPIDQDSLGGQLSTVTDEEWRTAHERLIAEHPELADQLRYTWDPDLDGSSLINPDERDIAHPEGHYDPAADERFNGGPSGG